MATTSTACFCSPILLLKSNNPPKVLFHSSIPTLQSSYLTLSPRHNYINPNSVYNIRTPFKLFEAQASFNSEIQPMVPPFNVLITGSSRGIGYALAKEFLKAGDNVIICSRTGERVDSAVETLKAEFGDLRVWGTKCDVRDGQDVKDLVAFAQEKIKHIDIWS